MILTTGDLNGGPLLQEAERRNVRVDSLVAKLVEAVVRDGLIDAVMDEPLRSRRRHS